MPGQRVKTGSGGGPSIPKMRSGEDAVLAQLIKAQAMQGIDQQGQQSQASGIGDLIGRAKSSIGSNAQPGTNLNIGPNGATVTSPLVREFKPEETVLLGGADNIGRHLAYLRNSIDNDPKFADRYKKATFRLGGGEKGEVLGIPTSLGDPEAQKLKFHLSDMNNRLVYLLSGKQINQEEFNRLSRTAPSFTDLDEINDPDHSLLKEKLNSFEADINNIKGRLIEGGDYNPKLWGEVNSETNNQQDDNTQTNGSNDLQSLEDELRQMYMPRPKR